jgi:hypothetical protein
MALIGINVNNNTLLSKMTSKLDYGTDDHRRIPGLEKPRMWPVEMYCIGTPEALLVPLPAATPHL